MSQETSYTIIQRDEHGEAVNTITGLDELAANTLAAVLRTGDAYQGERPWTCDIVRESTPAEQTAAIIDKWLADGEPLTRVDHLVACLRRVADTLETLGDKEIPGTGLKIELHLYTSRSGVQARMAALDELAAVFGRKAETNQAGHYHTGHIYGGGLRMVTIVDPATLPKPLVSDETIRQAEQIGKRYPDGINYVEPCDDCETNGRNCSKHQAEARAEARHPARIPTERVDVIIRQLDRMTAADADWWTWIKEQPEYDRDATLAVEDTRVLHLTDGTVLRWSEQAAWTRQAVAR